jgi:hypothetical protein
VRVLRAAARELNSAAAQADAMVAAVERLLGEELKLLISANSGPLAGDVFADDEDDVARNGGSRREFWLEYCTCVGAYGIYIVEELITQVRTSGGNTRRKVSRRYHTRWSDCTRAMKLQAIANLPDLLKNLAELASARSDDANEALVGSKHLLYILTGSGGGSGPVRTPGSGE